MPPRKRKSTVTEPVKDDKTDSSVPPAPDYVDPWTDKDGSPVYHQPTPKTA